MKSSGSGLVNEINGRGELLCLPHDTPVSAKVGTNFANQRRSSVGIVHLSAKSHSFFLFSDYFRF
jgi:hypothetical protein